MATGLREPGSDPSVAFTCIPASRDVAAPDDLRTLLSPEDLLDCLKPFPRFARVVSFLGDGWRYWYDLFRGLPRRSWVHGRFGNAVRIAVHRRFSEDLLRRLLEFEDLGFGAEVFFAQVQPGLYVGCFSNPKNPGAYALQKLPSDAALRLLKHLVAELGVAVVENPSE